MSYVLSLQYPVDLVPLVVRWETKYVSSGIKTELEGGTGPWQMRLVVTTDAKLEIGLHMFEAVATTCNDDSGSVRLE